MSATPEQDVPQQDQDFDAALDAYVEQRTAPVAGEAQPAPARQTPPAATDAPPVETPPPAATPASEPDDDDEQLPVDQRFARAQRREARIAADKAAAEARFATAEAARRHAESQINGYQGRNKQLETQVKDLKAATQNQDAQVNKWWEEAIESAPTVPTIEGQQSKAELQRLYAIDRKEREINAKAAEQELVTKQQAEQAEWARTQTRTAAETGMRQHAVAEIVGAIGPTARDLGLPEAEVKDIVAWLQSPEIAITIASLPPIDPDPAKWDVHKYRGYLLSQADARLVARKAEYEQRQVATNVAAAKDVYRAEQPVGAAGGPPGKKAFADMDFDEAMDDWYAQRR